LLHHYVHQISKEEAATFWGACGAIRREVFLKVEGFDERYRRPAIEDIELGYRLTGAGYRVRLLKGLMVTHLKRWDLLTMLKADFYRDQLARHQRRGADRSALAAIEPVLYRLPGVVSGEHHWFCLRLCRWNPERRVNWVGLQ
jgi:GT2 family glycosyltransferase